MLLPASGKLRSKEYGVTWFIKKKVSTFFPISGGSATATLKFLLIVKFWSFN